MIRLTMDEWRETLAGQDVNSPEDLQFVCPGCKTVQSARDLIEAGAGPDFESVEKYVGFSCVGRWSDDHGCDWTLGGLLQIHEVEVEVEGDRGVEYVPAFRPANMEAEAAVKRRED